VKPIYDSTKKIRDVTKPQVDSLVQRENEMRQRSDKLYSGISEGDQTDTILNAFPDTENSKELISQFEFLINQEQMVLSAISVEPPPSAEKSGIAPQSGKTYREVSGNFEVRGSYSQFKQLIADLNQLNRIVNVNKIQIANTTGEEGGTTGKYIIDFTAYWQPPVTTEDVRSGLESIRNPKDQPMNLVPAPESNTNIST